MHLDMRSHTGGTMSLGNGVIYGMSTCQKLNTRSSTEAEHVAVDDCMSQVLWTRYFLDTQGYNINDCMINQDNKSAILLEQNGQASSCKWTRHINIRYYFVTDHANCGEIKLKHCTSTKMLGDYFTKPLHGGLFNKFRHRILHIQTDPLIIPPEDHRSVLGQDHSHMTGQSRGQSCGQSQGTFQYDWTTRPQPVDKTMGRSETQPSNKQNVHAVMQAMSQPVGGWHVTSMTE